MSEFDQVKWEAPYEFPPGPKPMLLEAESPEAGKFGPLHVFAVVPLDAAEKAFEAFAFDGAHQKVAHLDLKIMIASEVVAKAARESIGRQPGIDFSFGPSADLTIDVRPARSLVACVEGKLAVDPDLGCKSGGFLRERGSVGDAP